MTNHCKETKTGISLCPMTRESAVQGIVEFIQEIYTEDTEEILLLAEKIVYDCKQSLEQGDYGEYNRAYARFLRGTTQR